MEEQLFDPLRRKNVAATPEERVRQWFIALLRDSLGVPTHLMNSEVQIKLGRKTYRADILIYNKVQQPLAIVECKRPDVTITQDVCEQAQRYNSAIGVKYIFLTNGNTTFGFRRTGQTFVQLGSIPTYSEML